MNETKKKWLVENSQDVTLEGIPCSVAGWKTDIACLAPDFGGFWHVEWETVERVLANNRNFTSQDVRLNSWAWLGIGTEIPQTLQYYSTF